MDKYTRILIIIVVLIYANALFLFFKGHYIDNANPVTDLKNNPNSNADTGPVIFFNSQDSEQVKTTKEGHIIEQEYGSGNIKIHNFTFDQEGSKIKTVLMSFRTLKIQPKPVCWEEEVTENITVSVPKMTGMTVNKIIDSVPKNIKAPMQLDIPQDIGDKDVQQILDENNASKEELTQQVSYYVTKCKTSEEIFLSSIFGTIDIMQNNEILATYSLTFRKEERDDKKYDYLVVEKDIFLPTDSGRYELYVKIWDKLSGERIEHKEEFFVK